MRTGQRRESRRDSGAVSKEEKMKKSEAEEDKEEKVERSNGGRGTQ